MCVCVCASADLRLYVVVLLEKSKHFAAHLELICIMPIFDETLSCFVRLSLYMNVCVCVCPSVDGQLATQFTYTLTSESGSMCVFDCALVLGRKRIHPCTTI